jgi:hypothetical protein
VDPVEEIARAQATALVSEDGDEVVLELQPGLSETEIDGLAAGARVPFPRELRALLRHTAGIDGALESIDFTGRTMDEDRLFNVWRTDPGELDRETALARDDELRAFADGLDDRFAFVDLREPEIGMGFSWGRYGPRTEVRRDGYRRIFAYARPEKQPGLLRRLFG